MKNITIVTAFYDIGREKWQDFPRSIDSYFNSFKRMCQLHNQVILFTDIKFKDQVEKIKKDNLIVFYDDIFNEYSDLLSRISTVQQSDKFKEGLTAPFCPEYWEPRYVLVNCLKSHFASKAISRVKDIGDIVAWVDFGYLRSDDAMPDNLNWQYDFEDKIYLIARRPIPPNVSIISAIKENIVYILGGTIVAPKNKWSVFKTYMDSTMETLLQSNLIDDDQGFHLICYLMHPDDFQVDILDVTGPLGPFLLFRKFQS